MPPKTRSGRTRRPSVNEAEEDEEQQLQTQLPTLDERDEEEPAPKAKTKKAPAAAAAAATAGGTNAPPPPATTAKRVPPQLPEGTKEEEDDEEEAAKPPPGTPAAAAREPEEEDEEQVVPTTDYDEISALSTTDEELISALVKKHRDKLYHDIIDNEQELILTDRASRKVHWKVLEHFMKNYPYHERDYGRVHVRNRMCSLLMDSCSETGYSETSLMAWKADEWAELMEDLEQVKTACLRADCRVIMPAVSDSAKDEERAKLDCYTKRFERVTKACTVNQCLANVRLKLQKRIAAGRTGTPNLDPNDVAAILTNARDSDSRVTQKFIYSLFVPDKDSVVDKADDPEEEEALPVPTPIFKNYEDLGKILSEKPFNLDWLQHHLESLMFAWKNDCSGEKVLHEERRSDTTPKNHLRRQTTPRSRLGQTRLAELDSLKRGRNALRDDHGEDPLETSRELAEQATGIPRGAGNKKQRTETKPAARRVLSGKRKTDADGAEEGKEDAQKSAASKGGRAFYEEKKSKAKIAFADSDSDDDDDDDDAVDEDDDDDDDDFSSARAQLSRAPDRRKSTGSASTSHKIYNGPPPDEGVFDERGNVINRHSWSDDECNALISGLEKFGVGKWVQIKNEYGQILRNRNSVQVKDKYRNMKRKGELPDKFL